MKISAQNRLKGVVKRIEKGQVVTLVQIEITTPTVMTALITKDALDELELKIGDEVKAITKATEIMVSKE